MTATRVRAKESKGYRLTEKRRLAIQRFEEMGKVFPEEIFLNPATHMMNTDELVNFALGNGVIPNLPEPVQQESFEDIEERVKRKFQILRDIVASTCLGKNKSLIISGSAGVGKSTEVMEVVKELGVSFELVKGKVTTGGLFSILYNNRHEGNLVIFDDVDVMSDETKLDLLKAVTDSSDERVVSWHSSRGRILDENDDEIPNNFVFEGTIIFISNNDIYADSKGNSKLAEHYNALISRSFVIDVAMKNTDWYIARLKDVIFNRMDESRLTFEVKNDIFQFMVDNKHKLMELSLRMVDKLRITRDTYGDNTWHNQALELFGKY